MKNYYQILGISYTANQKEVLTSFRNLAKQYHPDVSSHPDAITKFIEMSEAYEILSNEDKRLIYDQLFNTNKSNNVSIESDFDDISTEARNKAEEYSNLSLDNLIESLNRKLQVVKKVAVDTAKGCSWFLQLVFAFALFASGTYYFVKALPFLFQDFSLTKLFYISILGIMGAIGGLGLYALFKGEK